MIPFTIATIVLLAGLLVAEQRTDRRAIWSVKPLASACFIAVAFAAGALDSGYGRVVLVGLFLSWWGDVLLIPRAKNAFRAGLAAFLLAHVAYVAAFAVAGLDMAWTAAALIPAAGTAVVVDRWLAPHVDDKMRVPVRAYIAVISIMVAASLGVVTGGGSWIILAAAVLFWVSDLFVARQRFVSPGFVNRAIGLPLYYGAQLLFAWSISL